jgi:hypothetical protein
MLDMPERYGAGAAIWVATKLVKDGPEKWDTDLHQFN